MGFPRVGTKATEFCRNNSGNSSVKSFERGTIFKKGHIVDHIVDLQYDASEGASSAQALLIHRDGLKGEGKERARYLHIPLCIVHFPYGRSCTSILTSKLVREHLLSIGKALGVSLKMLWL